MAAMEDSHERKKGSKGKRKIEMKRIEDNNRRLVTFSKRRSGIFKKAGELSTLCGAEIAVIVRSPAGRIFGFGHPNIDAIVQRYENSEVVAEHCEELAVEMLEAEKERLTAAEASGGGNGGGEMWWAKEIDGMGSKELGEFRDALERLRNEAKKKVEEMTIAEPCLSSSSLSHEEQLHVVSSRVEESNLHVPRSSDFRLWNN